MYFMLNIYIKGGFGEGKGYYSLAIAKLFLALLLL
jgi:hypothetical protein